MKKKVVKKKLDKKLIGKAHKKHEVKKKVEKFQDVKVPKAEHAKEIAKAKSAKQQLKNSGPVIVSVNGNKVLKYGVTATGVYSSYIGNVKKLGGNFEVVKAKYKKRGEWAEPHELHAKIEELKKSLGIESAHAEEVHDEEVSEDLSVNESEASDDFDLDEDLELDDYGSEEIE